MSASFYWRPVKGGHSIETSAARKLEKIFGATPYTLSKASIEKLEVLAALEEDRTDNIYDDLIAHILTHDEIEIYTE